MLMSVLHLLLQKIVLSPEVALAQSTPGPAMPTLWEQLLPFAVIFVIFYFLIIRPQTRRIRDQQKVLESLKRGDDVLTSSGIFGTIEGMTEKFVTLEIAPGVRIKILKSQVSGLVKEPVK